MAQYAALLRGVNLGGQRKTGSAELRSCFESIGLDEVQTFRTSGNVVFETGRESRAKLAQRIEKALADSFGFDVVVFLRSAAEVRAIAEHRPFPARLVGGSKGKLQVALLPSKPPAGARRQALELATDADRLALDGRELYWLPSGGTRDSGLNLKALEKLVGPWTMRTKGTLELLADKHFA
jgi:uncharacterized protein (DUF1697 family)